MRSMKKKDMLDSEAALYSMKILGVDPLVAGDESIITLCTKDDKDKSICLKLSLDGEWSAKIDGKDATKKQLSDMFKSEVFKGSRSIMLKSLLNLKESKDNIKWVSESNQELDCLYEEYASCIDKAIQSIQSPVRFLAEDNAYSGKNLVKFAASGYDPKFDPERLRRQQNIDSYHLKKLPSLLKRVFPNAFEEVEVKKIQGYDSKYSISLVVDEPEIKISHANRIERVVKLVPQIRRILDFILRSQNLHIDFNDVYVKNVGLTKDSNQTLQEGEGGGMAAGGAMSAGGDAGGPDVSPGGSHPGGAISSEDVLGKVEKGKGYMGKGNFYIPKKVLPLQRRWPMTDGSKRKKGGKYPKVAKVISNYSDLTEEEKSQLKPILVYNLPASKIEEILDNTTIENQRYEKQQFLKFLNKEKVPYDVDTEYVGLFTQFPKECFAMAVLAFDRAQDDDCYVAEIQSFKSGYGQELLLKILKNQKNLWLCCNPTADQKLLDFYRRPCFGFKEHVVKHSVWNNEAHFFYTPTCDEENLLGYIGANYDAEKQMVEDEFQMPDVEEEPSQFVELKPDEVVDANDIYFQTEFPEKKDRYQYSAHIVSMNGDDELEYDDSIESDHPLSIKEVFNELWKQVPAKYHVAKDMDEAHKEYNSKLAEIKSQNQGKSEQEVMTLQMQIPFPMIEDLFFGSSEDGIRIAPDKEVYDLATQKGLPAGYYENDDSSKLTFNKFAADMLYTKQVIGG